MTGIILAGGKNLRMGRNKAFLEVDGERIIDRTRAIFVDLFDEVLLVTNSPLDYISLNLRIVTDLYEDKGNRVSLMTLHCAKGLEFPAVFVIGLVEGITPTKKGDMEEERRIVFVGISRAMKLLYISYSHTFMGQACKKSIFLDEIMGVREVDMPVK